MNAKTLTTVAPLTRPAFTFEAAFLPVCWLECVAKQLRETLAKPWIKRAGYVALVRDRQWVWHGSRVFECGHFCETQNL